MKQLSDLTREQLEDIVGQIRDTLWQDPVTGQLDPEQSWDVETIEWVSSVLEDAGLKPDPVRSAPPTPQEDIEAPAVAAMRSALEAFIGTIEATGGCVRPGGTTSGLSDEEAADFEANRPVPAGDEGWPDLADAYLLACRALGRQPIVQDADADEVPNDDQQVDEIPELRIGPKPPSFGVEPRS
jgi:hypothetical protein